MAIKVAHEYVLRPVVVRLPCRDVMKPHALELEEQWQVGMQKTVPSRMQYILPGATVLFPPIAFS